METYAIYVRVSETRDRAGTDAYMSPEEQEAKAREWIERAGAEAYFVPAECVDENVSGATAADDRRLGRLIERCETGEFSGIVVRSEDRFARDPLAGAVALDRLTECGARLVATYSGFDSKNLTPEKQMWFDFNMAMGRAQRVRNRLARMNGSRRAADQGYHLSTNAPLGYRLVDRRTRSDGTPGAGKLELDPVTAPLVREAFAMRAAGASANRVREFLNAEGVGITKSGVRVVLANRVYLGVATKPTERKGVTEDVPHAHDPILTEPEFQAAQAMRREYQPRDGSIVSQVRLAGLVRCAGCGRRMQVQKGTRAETSSYACRTDGCPGRAAISAEILDPWVAAHIELEYQAGNEAILAALSGEDRYATALAAVTAAQDELDTYRREIRVSDVGVAAWKADVEHREAAVRLARDALGDVPKPAGPISGEGLSGHPFWGDLREIAPSLIDRIVVSPVGRGRRVRPAERCVVEFVGA